VGYTHSRIPALTLMMLMERRSDGTSDISDNKSMDLDRERNYFVFKYYLSAFY